MTITEVQTTQAIPAPPTTPPRRMTIDNQQTTAQASDALPVPNVDRDSIFGLLYRLKCGIQAKFNWDWEPKEPHDKLDKNFRQLCKDIKRLATGKSTADIERLARRLFAILAAKGGAGKTPTTAGLAAVYQLATGCHVLLGDFNHNTGTTGERNGVYRDVENVGLLFDVLFNHQMIADYNTATGHFPTHEELNIDILLSNISSEGSESKTQPSVERVIETILTLKDAYHGVFCDTGNGNDHPINEGALFASDVAGFTLIAGKKDQYEPFVATLMEFAKLGHYTKVQAAPKIICSTKKGDKPEQFVAQLQTFVERHLARQKWTYTSPESGTQHTIADEEDIEQQSHMVDLVMNDLGIVEDNIFMIPFSPYIEDNGVTSIKRRATGMPALIAYARILKRMLEIPVPSPEEKKGFIQQTLDGRETNQAALAARRAADAQEAKIRAYFASCAEDAVKAGDMQVGLTNLARATKEQKAQ